MVVGIATGLASDCRPSQQGEEISALVRVPVATSGVVPCKVDATNGAIRRGDLLVASPNPGHAMKAQRPVEPGTVNSKALEPLASGMGLIKVLVMFR